MLMGLVMLALPITIISENFALEYQRKELLRMENEEKLERELLQELQRKRDSRRKRRGSLRHTQQGANTEVPTRRCLLPWNACPYHE